MCGVSVYVIVDGKFFSGEEVVKIKGSFVFCKYYFYIVISFGYFNGQLYGYQVIFYVEGWGQLGVDIMCVFGLVLDLMDEYLSEFVKDGLGMIGGVIVGGGNWYRMRMIDR